MVSSLAEHYAPKHRDRFICTPEGGEEDNWTEDDGLRCIVLHLPYEEVCKLPDARPLMLAKARLGLAA